MSPLPHGPIPPLAGLYAELQSAHLALAALHRAIAQRVDADPLEQRAHQEAAARIDRQALRFTPRGPEAD